jgi:hypothetical protein
MFSIIIYALFICFHFIVALLFCYILIYYHLFPTYIFLSISIYLYLITLYIQVFTHIKCFFLYSLLSPYYFFSFVHFPFISHNSVYFSVLRFTIFFCQCFLSLKICPRLLFLNYYYYYYLKVSDFYYPN